MKFVKLATLLAFAAASIVMMKRRAVNVPQGLVTGEGFEDLVEFDLAGE